MGEPKSESYKNESSIKVKTNKTGLESLERFRDEKFVVKKRGRGTRPQIKHEWEVRHSTLIKIVFLFF